MHPGGPRFDHPVTENGYAWWYIDALSDDGRHGITAIGFIGSVFSPYYAWARRRGPADPLNHCALNVAVYTAGSGRWAMTERGSTRVVRDAATLAIGPSAMHWSGDALQISVDERCAPLPRRLRGSIRLMPQTLHTQCFALDEHGRHRWTPFAPRARVEVHFAEPDLEWSGSGYFDSNTGDEPLEDAFAGWTWSRASLPGRTVVLYDTAARGGEARSLALQFAAEAQPIEPPSVAGLPRTRWGLARQTRTDRGQAARVVKTLEDAPFYSRSLLDTQLLGFRGQAVHESLCLDRFRSRWVQCLLPFRMPRLR
jgi:carotenoid 1,2-hydratase